MLLIHPPCAKPGESPAGIAKLAGALIANGISCSVWDASLEGLLWLMDRPLDLCDRWSSRAHHHRKRNLDVLRSPEGASNLGRYKNAVNDINRLLAAASAGYGATAGLGDYRHSSLSPLRSKDLLLAAENPDKNPFYPWFSRRLTEKIETDGPAVAGFSLNFLSQALTTFAMIGYLRKNFPSVKTVLGGGLITSWLQSPERGNLFRGLADQLVSGPGEEALLAIHGISDTKHTGIPEYGMFSLSDYLSPGIVIPYSTASGCWWNRCSFCPEQAEGNRYRPLPATKALDDIRQLVVRHRPSLLHITDNAISPELLRRIVDSPPGADWYGFARFEEHLANPDFCRSLRASGCVMLKLGLESGDQSVLDRLGKGINLHLVSKVLDNLHDAGIAVYCYLLFGTPHEDEAAARRTLEFTASKAASIGFLNLAIFNMPVNSEQASEYGSGLFYEGDMALYTGFNHPKAWGRDKIRRFIGESFSRHPAIAPIISREPPVFRSNHAPFFSANLFRKSERPA